MQWPLLGQPEARSSEVYPVLPWGRRGAGTCSIFCSLSWVVNRECFAVDGRCHRPCHPITWASALLLLQDKWVRLIWLGAPSHLGQKHCILLISLWCSNASRLLLLDCFFSFSPFCFPKIPGFGLPVTHHIYSNLPFFSVLALCSNWRELSRDHYMACLHHHLNCIFIRKTFLNSELSLNYFSHYLFLCLLR